MKRSARDRAIAWNFHAGLPDVSMGARRPARCAQDAELHAGLTPPGFETRVVRVGSRSATS